MVYCFGTDPCNPGGGVPLFWSTYTHTHDRLDKLRSALAEAQLNTIVIHKMKYEVLETCLRKNNKTIIKLFY